MMGQPREVLSADFGAFVRAVVRAEYSIRALAAAFRRNRMRSLFYRVSRNPLTARPGGRCKRKGGRRRAGGRLSRS